MRFIKCMALLVAALVLQSTILQLSFLRDSHPDLILFVLVVLSLKYGSIYGVFCGFFIGIVQDFYMVETLGMNALSKSVIGYFLGLFDESRFTFSATTKLLLLTIAFVIHDMISGIAVGLTTKEALSALILKSLPAAVITLIAGTVYFYYIQPRIKNSRA